MTFPASLRPDGGAEDHSPAASARKASGAVVGRSVRVRRTQRVRRTVRGRGSFRTRLGAVLAAVATAVLVLTGCTPFGAPGAQPSSDPAATQGAPPGLERFYTQDVAWQPCEGGKFECATVSVPIDYASPSGDTAKLALIRLAGRNAKANLVVNPGGPGGSGYDMVKDSAQTMFSAKLLDAYTVIGFDPRGVKRSAPVTCVGDTERDALRQETFDPNTAAGLAAQFAAQKKLVDACEANTGPILAHADTVSAAKDLDIIRAAAAHQVHLDYLGYSYGTFLGSTYASLFPDRVGRMVLDGALDPSLGNHEITRGQAKAFEMAIHAYVRSCLSKSDCPLAGPEDNAVAQIRSLVTSTKERPLSTSSGRILNSTDFVNGFILPLYNDSNYPALSQGLKGALRGDGSSMLRLADIAADREQDGTYSSNSTFAFTAYNCLDYPTDADPAAMRAEDAELRRDSPTLGEFFAYGGVNCRDWPYKPVRTPAPAHYTGQSPILVVGTTGDPATPVQWAGNLRDQLGNAALLTWKGEGHTAYGRGSKCVDNAVDSYLVDRKAPTDRAQC
ncbi:alpha/beta hydrolase [Sinomonas notoginsengisoli]|uniref:alpha/beta hydrolase n=1 Tax=Sinomonas notoginsengisoli TaxID=1457311 RepID=UPI001F4206DA|nr:alpha/beta hydrolase [Sinomonas notoginsengisoli]